MTPSPVFRLGQHQLPSFADFSEAFSGIVSRGWYANNGPLVRELDGAFGGYVGTRHSVCVSNETMAFMCAARAHSLKGTAVAAADASIQSLQGLGWGLAQVALADTDAVTGRLTWAAVVAACAEPCAVLVTLRPHDPVVPPEIVENCSALGIPVIVDAVSVLGCEVDGVPVGASGITHVWGFGDRQIVSAGEGGIITTADDELARRLGDCRSFHVASAAERVVPRMNAKMSEAPAALILGGWRELDTRITRNAERVGWYRTELEKLPGVELVEPRSTVESNHGELWVEVPNGAPLVAARLAELGIEAGTLARAEVVRAALGRADGVLAGAEWPGHSARRDRLLQLPLNVRMNSEHVGKVVAALRGALDG